MKRTFLLVVSLLALFTANVFAQTKQLQIACAADLQPVMPTLAAAYRRATGVHLVTAFGSSATLAQQLANGAPQDVFLSADSAHPQQLIDSGIAFGADPAHPSAPTAYARGVLVLWARHDSPAQPLSLDSLKNPRSQRITRIAIANPQHAPYGLAAVRALHSLKLYDQLHPKLVTAENIAQTAEFAESGNAQLALISLTIASSPHFRGLGTFVRIPTDAYPPIRQSAVVLKSSRQQQLARDFLRWLTSPTVQQQLRSFGLDPAK